jgi:hypothetical protein
MKLTQRQLDKINSLISEEADVRKNLHESMYENRKQSLITESLMFEAYRDVSPESFVSDIEDYSTNYSQGLITTINTKLYKSLASFMKLSGVATMTPNSWMEELEAFDVYEHEMQLANDIKVAIDDYAMALAKAAITVVGPPEDEASADLEPRYSEYE